MEKTPDTRTARQISQSLVATLTPAQRLELVAFLNAMVDEVEGTEDGAHELRCDVSDQIRAAR